MAATTMQLTKLVQKLQSDFPALTFMAADDFLWSSEKKTIYYAPEKHAQILLLHELGHALCAHTDFAFDIELLSQEREAWEIVRRILAEKYTVQLDDELIEDSLDTYRDWLHKRALCPSCGLTGLQTKTSTYVCANCRCSWRPNDARRCALRRYTATV